MLTYTSILKRTERLYGDKPAILAPDATLTWHEWLNRIQQAGSMLLEAGVEPGQRFGILSLNSFRQAELIYAGYWLGITPVPINFRLAPPEIQFILKDSGCEVLFVDPTFTDLLETEALAPWASRHISLDPASYDDTLAGLSPTPAADPAEDDEAILLYTGGTSGRSKGVRLSHKNIVSNGMQISLSWPASFSAVVLHVAPMFHSADLVMTPFTIHGAAHVFLPQFSPELLFETMQRYKVTATLLVPTMVLMSIKANIVDQYDLSSLQSIAYGSSPMDSEWIQRATKAFPQAELRHAYGLTETSPILTLLDFTACQAAIESGNYGLLKSCGRPLAGIDINIVDDDGVSLPPGEAGEVVVRGPNVFKSYLNLPQVTELVLKDGWFHTGDAGRLDAEGYLYIMDRKKDMIITGGENVYSSEVETVLYQHPAVFEAAVIGLPDDKYGEQVCVVVVLKPDTQATEAELIEFCQGKIGGYKIPRQVKFVEQMPKSAIGKILKRELRETYGDV